MKRLALAAAILASTPVEAAAHCYSVWRYPQPQRCRVAGHVARPGLVLAAPSHPEPPLGRPEPSQDLDMPLPALDWMDGGGADEMTRARLMLRAALGDANAH